MKKRRSGQALLRVNLFLGIVWLMAILAGFSTGCLVMGTLLCFGLALRTFPITNPASYDS